MRQFSFLFHKPDLKILNLVVLLLGATLLVFEYLLHIPWVVTHLPPPSPGLSYPFPEVGLKFERYFNAGHVNCLFFGSSMVDAGLDPEILEKRLNQHSSQQIKCVNFGLTGAKAETSAQISQTLVNWQSSDLIILGLSPIEFNEKDKVTRQMAALPVFQKNQKFNLEGWLFNSFRLPWFYSGLLNRKDKDFIRTQQSYDILLNSRGFRKTDIINEVGNKTEEFRLHDFYVNQVDLNSLEEMINYMQIKGVKIIMVEMPVKPSYFPFLVEGGSSMYEQRFVEPIQKSLQKYGLSLIRTQPIIGNLLLEEGHWINENHMNSSGAKIFTNYLADQILQRGDW
jgi:hypothetical protein